MSGLVELGPVPPPEPDRGASYRVCVGAAEFMAALTEASERSSARLWVQFSTFEGDASGQAVAALLMDRADRGLDVRVVLDHYSDVIVSDILPFAVHRRAEARDERARTRALLATLQQHGVPVHRTAPIGFLGRFLLHRDHKKIVIVDDEAFVGGINVSDHNFAWHDFMVRVRGPVVEELAADFAATWVGESLVLDTPRPDGDYVLNQCAGRASIFDHVVALIDGATTSVVVESPYLLGDRVEPAIRRAAERGVAVTVVLPARANRGVIRLWVKHLRRRFDHPNVTVHGYHGDHDMTHAKLVIVDGVLATFGSLNFLELEALTQKELNVFTRDVGCIRQLEALVAADVADSEVLRPPRHSVGRFTYTALHAFFRWWTGRLVRDPAWRRRYC